MRLYTLVFTGSLLINATTSFAHTNEQASVDDKTRLSASAILQSPVSIGPWLITPKFSSMIKRDVILTVPKGTFQLLD